MLPETTDAEVRDGTARLQVLTTQPAHVRSRPHSLRRRASYPQRYERYRDKPSTLSSQFPAERGFDDDDYKGFSSVKHEDPAERYGPVKWRLPNDPYDPNERCSLAQFHNSPNHYSPSEYYHRAKGYMPVPSDDPLDERYDQHGRYSSEESELSDPDECDSLIGTRTKS